MLGLIKLPNAFQSGFLVVFRQTARAGGLNTAGGFIFITDMKPCVVLFQFAVDQDKIKVFDIHEKGPFCWIQRGKINFPSMATITNECSWLLLPDWEAGI